MTYLDYATKPHLTLILNSYVILVHARQQKITKKFVRIVIDNAKDNIDIIKIITKIGILW